jgi:dipeptidyl aminopeptidase/acylaminoacyl peptidase
MKQLLWGFLLYNTFAIAQPVELGNLVLDGLPTISQSVMDDIEKYQQGRSATVADWLNNELLITTRFGNVSQVHVVSEPMSDRTQLTFEKEGVTNAQVCPDGMESTFLYSMDRGGNENFQLYLFDLLTNQSEMLTNGTSRHVSAKWNFEGNKIAYLSNARNGTDLDLYIMLIEDGARTTELIKQQAGGGWGILDWSFDDQKMILTEYVSATESKLYVLDLNNPDAVLKPLWPDTEKRTVNGGFMRGDSIIYISDYQNNVDQLRIHNIKTATDQVYVESKKWEISSMTTDLSHDWLAYTYNKGGVSDIMVKNLNTGVEKRVPLNASMIVVQNMRFSDHNYAQLAITVGTSVSQNDVFIYDPKLETVTVWTDSEVGPVNTKSFVEAELIEFTSFDGLVVPAFIYKSKKTDGPSPVLISIHGGPEGQSLPSYNPMVQYWVSLGITVIVPNVRGSSGYGKEYISLDNGMLRENSVKDIGALLDWIANQPYLNKDRVAVYGGSYGGYMSLACMTHYNDRLRCGVDLFGISNFVTFLENTSAYRRDLRRAEYGDERDPAMRAHQIAISPNQHLDKITKPMFIYQGKNDPRVPLSESEQMVAALKNKGNTVWYVMAKDEGHSLAKKANRDYTQAAIAAFLQEYLLKD